MGFINVLEIDQLPAESAKLVKVNNRKIALFHYVGNLRSSVMHAFIEVGR